MTDDKQLWKVNDRCWFAKDAKEHCGIIAAFTGNHRDAFIWVVYKRTPTEIGGIKVDQFGKKLYQVELKWLSRVSSYGKEPGYVEEEEK